MLITQKARAHTDTLSLNLLTMFTSSLVLLPMAIIFGHTLTGFSTGTWLALLGLGLVPQFLGWLAINYAMGHLPAARVSVMLLGQPVVTAILGILVLQESLAITDLAGGMMVLSGIYLVNQRSKGKIKSDAYTQSS
jgi:drug/metabolite transporter (DMT)-like permease